MATKSLRTEILESSSIRGVPRFTKKNSTSFNIFFGLFILMSFTGATYFTVKVIRNFIEQEDVIVIKNPYNNESLLPDVAICDTILPDKWLNDSVKFRNRWAMGNKVIQRYGHAFPKWFFMRWFDIQFAQELANSLYDNISSLYKRETPYCFATQDLIARKLNITCEINQFYLNGGIECFKFSPKMETWPTDISTIKLIIGYRFLSGISDRYRSILRLGYGAVSTVYNLSLIHI